MEDQCTAGCAAAVIEQVCTLELRRCLTVRNLHAAFLDFSNGPNTFAEALPPQPPQAFQIDRVDAMVVQPSAPQATHSMLMAAAAHQMELRNSTLAQRVACSSWQ